MTIPHCDIWLAHIESSCRGHSPKPHKTDSTFIINVLAVKHRCTSTPSLCIATRRTLSQQERRMLRRAAPSSPTLSAVLGSLTQSTYRCAEPATLALATPPPQASSTPTCSPSVTSTGPNETPFRGKRSRTRRRTRAAGLRNAAQAARSRPPAGFWNTGQSCHLGATLTALAALPSMQRWARSRDSAIAEALRASVSGSRAPLDPRPAAAQIYASGWSARVAQDAHETLGRLLDALGDECHTRREPDQLPPPKSPLTGWSAVVRTCTKCGSSSDAILHSFRVLSLPLPTSNRSLISALLNAYASTDTNVEASCDTCERSQSHTRTHSIARFPSVLALHLQKAYLTSGCSVDATQFSTSFPEKLTLPRGTPIPVIQRPFRVDGHSSPRCISANGTTTSFPSGPYDTAKKHCSALKRSGVVQYSLRSVVQHFGGSGSSAHFIAVVSGGEGLSHEGLASLCGGRWWIVDDGRVARCDKATALNPRAAYLLFYEREDSATRDTGQS